MTGLRHAHISSLISGQNLGQIYASNHFHGSHYTENPSEAVTL